MMFGEVKGFLQDQIILIIPLTIPGLIKRMSGSVYAFVNEN